MSDSRLALGKNARVVNTGVPGDAFKDYLGEKSSRFWTDSEGAAGLSRRVNGPSKQ